MATISTTTYAAGGIGPGQRIDVQLDAILKKGEERLRDLMIRTIGKINTALVANTPYKTGNLRRSWYAQINQPPGPVSPDRTGAELAATVGELNTVAESIQLGDIYYVINGANYAGYVEYGTSKMAPRAFTRTVIQEAETYAKQAAAEMGLT